MGLRDFFRKRKGQMELIGIAVVMVLIILGVTFYISLSMNAPKKTHESFMKKEMGQNIVDSIVKSTTKCRGLDFATILEDCAKKDSMLCDTNSSCQYAEAEIKSILEDVLDERFIQYSFTAVKDANGLKEEVLPEITSGSPCTQQGIEVGLVEVETPGIQPIPLYPGTLTLMLQICN